VVSAVYAATVTWEPGQDSRLAASAILRVPFLFVVGLFYGYFVTQIRRRRSEATAAQVRELAKSELLAAVSHDLRGPLGNAESLLNLVLDGEIADDHDTRVLLLRAQINVRRVVSLVSNLLQAAAIEAGTVPLRWEPVRLNDVVDDVVHPEGGAALLKGVTLRTAPCADLPTIDADFLQVTRIVTNLVNNAIKYTPGGGTVTVRTAHDADAVRVSVEDDGPGMTREQCDLLFAPYRRVHLGGYTPGTGLGLFIVKRLSEALHGTVTVRSAPGAGSTFTVTFPRPAPLRATTRPLHQPTAEAATVPICAPASTSAQAA
jgi:signal transduction histidine kinase